MTHRRSPLPMLIFLSLCFAAAVAACTERTPVYLWRPAQPVNDL
jgi:hypothetical protein